jgi:hypothetical protein
MDNKKELENNGSESKGQVQVSSLELSKLSLFKKDSYYAFVYKKTEKIATAIYMLTGFFSDSEPVKNKLRQASLEMLSKGLIFSSNSIAERVSAIESFISNSLECLSILELAKVSGLISIMNSDILSNEIANLIQTVEKNEAEILSSHQSVLTSDFFNLPSELSTDKDLEKGVTSMKPLATTLSSQSVYTIKERNFNQTQKSVIKDNRTAIMSDRKPISKEDRSQQIVSLIKKDSVMTIKDFTSVIRDCSEKTIQRELLSLVSKGILKKEGERRWSRYSLK